MKIVNRSLNYQQGKLAIVLLWLLTLSASRGETTSGTPIDSGVPAYTVTDIGFLPGFTQMTGSGINIDGDIVGTAYTGFAANGNLTGGHGFLYHDLKVIDLGPGAATAINGSGRGARVQFGLFRQEYSVLVPERDFYRVAS